MQRPNRLLRGIAWCITLLLFHNTASAGAIVLSDSPLVNGLTNNIAPNILFILDDSGSMASEYMPDSIATSGFYNFDTDARRCVRNFGFNTIYFNPSISYELPLNADGSSLDPADFNEAYEDGFDQDDDETVDLGEVDVDLDTTSTTGNTNLATTAFRTTNGSRDIRVTHNAHGFLATEPLGTDHDQVRFRRTSGGTGNFSVGGTTIIYDQWYDVRSVIDANTYVIRVASNATSNATSNISNLRANWQNYTTTSTSTPVYYYTRYTSNPASPPTSCQADNQYTVVYINNQTAAEQQNFANWYQYYRSRMLLMKSAAGRAFSGVNSEFRVGFTVISDKGTDPDEFLGVKRFTGTHKQDWYDMLYSINGNSFTPLRAALSKAGRYYAGELGSTYAAGQNDDPIQYSCQQNFSILTTDGYWNVNSESPASGSSATNTDAQAPGTAVNNYGPFGMGNLTRVGNADGGEAAPFGDTYSNTLADVAAYFYKNDLRPNSGVGGLIDDGVSKIDVSANNVPPTGDDNRTHQRMQTFTLGLGLDGTRAFPGDWAAIKDGSLAWPNPITNTDAQRIDDLWHAAVNGRGQYMSAKNASAVEDQLNDALAAMRYEKGAAAAAATSTLQPVDGDNTAFLAQYVTGHWVGNLLARSIDVDTGEIDSTETADIWSAQAKLDAMVEAAADSRTIYTFSSAAANRLKSFDAANLADEISAGHFRSDTTGSHLKLTQYDDWTFNQKSAATSQAMIKFLRGQTEYEIPLNPELDPDDAALPAPRDYTDDLFRDRQHVLGDIGSAAPVYVRKSPFAYLDAGYAAFASSAAIVNRLPTVYVGANDGMLHAFNAAADSSGGGERWAYIPSMLIPNLYKLADNEYKTNHRYFVDGPIVVGDAFDGTNWATLLVGGLGHGGKGYYALDITNPSAPKALWEFDTSDDADMGYSYGNPIITKRASDGKWVIVFASGYNNGSGDGKGRLYVVDAFTGAILAEIITDDSQTDESLSGIARISNYVEDGLRNNSTQYVYGGDLSGNLWRFNINVSGCDECATAEARLLLARTSTTAGEQPITVQPELARIRDGSGAWHRVIYFGTGRALGPNDITDLDPANDVAQAIYAVKDAGSSIGVLSGSMEMVDHTLRNATLDEIAAGDSSRRIDSPQPVDWQLKNGWYITTPVGERFTVDPGLQLGTLVFAANIHEQGYCEPTGRTVLYQVDYRTGKVLRTTEYGKQIVGITQLQTQGGAGQVVIDPVFADGSTGNTNQVGSPGGVGNARRVSWREIE